MSTSTNTTAAQPLDLDSIKALAAIRNRLELAHRVCTSLAPKQAVGELLDVTLNMPDWESVHAALIAQARAARLDTTASAKECQYPNCGCTSRATCNFNYDRAPVPAQQAAAVYPVPIDWRKVVADLTAMKQATAKRAAEIITYVCEEGLKLAAKAPAAQADEKLISWGHDLQKRLMVADDQGDDDLHNLLGETACLLAALTGRPEIGRGAASPASTPEASQKAAAVAAPSEQGYWYRIRPLDVVGRVNGEWSDWKPCSAEQYAEGIPSSWPREIEFRAAIATAGAATTSDTARLDFMAEDQCQIDHIKREDGAGYWYWLAWPHLSEQQSECYKTPREAIDAQMAALRATQQEGGK